MSENTLLTEIPTRHLGSLKINGDYANGDFTVPLSTFETTLFASIARGMKVIELSGGINTSILSDNMTRSILLESDSASNALKFIKKIKQETEKLKEIVESTSSVCKFDDMNIQLTGNLIFIRFSFLTGEASGHNMTTKASDAILHWVLDKYDQVKYISISGNYCTDKKNSAVNGILGRGKYVIADITISNDICKKYLRSTAHKISDLNLKKNLIGSIVSGSVRSANAHFANILLAVYLTTGQDVANIIEASQGITHAEVRDNNLYFSVTVPNIIVGTIGNGKELDFARKNLELLKCYKTKNSAKKLSEIIAATILCGELSLLAAQTNLGELTKSHTYYERHRK